MEPMLANGLDAVPADFIKTLLVVALVVVNTWALFRKPSSVPQPLQIEKLDKFATRDFLEVKHAEVTRRLDGHDADVRAIYEEIKRGRQQSQEQASAQNSALYAKIDAVRAELRGDVQDVHSRINEVLGEVRELKGRVEEKL